MSADDVVDISGTSVAELRRIWLRIGVPVGGVALVIIAILAITLYSNRANRSGVLLLSDNLLAVLQERIAQQVVAYVSPATRAAQLARDIAARNAIANPRAALEAFASSALRQIPQIDALYTGDAAGNFMIVQRSAAGSIDTKLIRNAPGARVVEWIRHDTDGRVTGHELDPKDDYDPRTRSWYQGALSTDNVFWTNVYVFFTHRTPGITAAVLYRSPDGAAQIFGVDITLKALSDFLATLKIGTSGRAVVIDETGHLIAAPDASRILREHDGQLTTARLDQIDDPALTAAYDRFRVEGYGRRTIMVNDAPIVSIVSRLPTDGRDWSLVMVVPEKDFAGFVASNGRKTLALSLVVIVLTAALAALLVRQGLRADRTARLLLDRGKAIERQGFAFASLSQQGDLFDRSQDTPIQALTTMLVDLAAARRVSIWQLRDNQLLLHCEDAYERGGNGHVAGLQLTRVELPNFFRALESGEEINVADAANERRTAEFYRVLMHSFDSRSLQVVPVRRAESVVGVIMLEDATQHSDTHDFTVLIANMLAIRMRIGAEVPAHREVVTADVTPVSAGERNFDAELILRGLNPATTSADVFPTVAVMVIKFSDAAAMAARCSDDASVLADRVAAALQDIAAAHDIPYMKLVGHDVVAAAGCAPNDTTAILRIADAAVAARERCLELFEAAGHPPSLRIGIDFGIVIGSQVGREPRLFNLWGEAVRTADMMAASSAGPGAIQVSEAAYHRLRQHFLFRPRGTFHLPHVGTAQTFVLGSRR
ncbi:MAG TPA: adenylate/guanylate cyclase domain-containing protein [Acetobacteraceae bacterium]|nr:adenylate/guanylate cyclase domain-containing protein [Acetobacteraceae bacterium]